MSDTLTKIIQCSEHLIPGSDMCTNLRATLITADCNTCRFRRNVTLGGGSN